MGIGAVVTIAMQKETGGVFGIKFSITPDGVSYTALEEWKDYNRVVLGDTLLSGALPARAGVRSQSPVKKTLLHGRISGRSPCIPVT